MAGSSVSSNARIEHSPKCPWWCSPHSTILHKKPLRTGPRPFCPSPSTGKLCFPQSSVFAEQLGRGRAFDRRQRWPKAMTYQQAVEFLEDHDLRVLVLPDRLKWCSQPGLCGLCAFNCPRTSPSGRDPPLFLQPASTTRSLELRHSSADAPCRPSNAALQRPVAFQKGLHESSKEQSLYGFYSTREVSYVGR